MPSPDPRPFHAAASAASHVTQLAIAVILGTWGGSKLDARLASAPWFTLLGAILGVSAGMILLIRSFQELSEDDDDPDRPDPA